MPKVLELTKLIDEHRVAQMQVGRGGIEPGERALGYPDKLAS